ALKVEIDLAVRAGRDGLDIAVVVGAGANGSEDIGRCQPRRARRFAGAGDERHIVAVIGFLNEPQIPRRIDRHMHRPPREQWRDDRNVGRVRFVRGCGRWEVFSWNRRLIACATEAEKKKNRDDDAHVPELYRLDVERSTLEVRSWPRTLRG